MVKECGTTVEDQISWAEKEWLRIKKDCSQGIINRPMISYVIDRLNMAHKRAIKENKRHLIK